MAFGFSARFCRKCLAISLSVDQMNCFAKLTKPDYDIHQSLGFPKGHPISIHEAANRIAVDMIQNGYYIDFVETLIMVDSHGYMGYKFAFRGLDDVIGDVLQAGYSYDKTSGIFFEDQNRQITKNWGRLKEDDERSMAVLKLDIAENSHIVKNNPKQLVDKTYNMLREIVETAVVSRFGRLWTWEGDGALCAFMLGDYSRLAVFAGMEILNSMFVFNKTENQLNTRIKLRISVHSGGIFYSGNEIKTSKSDIVKTAVFLESNAAVPNSLVISESLAMSQDQSLIDIFSNVKNISNSAGKYRIYQYNQGKA